MKKKKGFTLAEILGVIVILGLLLMLVIPLLVKNIKKKEQLATEVGNKLIIEAAEQYTGENSQNYPPGTTKCLHISTLIEDGKLVSPVKDVVTGDSLENKTIEVKTTIAGDTTYKIVDSDKCEERADEIPIMPGKVNVLFINGANTKSVSPGSASCILKEGATECEITFPTIESNPGYLCGGFSKVSEAKKSDILPNMKVNAQNGTYYGNSIDGTPKFKLETEGKVSITYPSGCANPYSCTYKVGNGTKIGVEPNREDPSKPATITIQVGTSTKITAEAKDTCGNVAASTYDVSRTKLYVASFGNDTTGFGTVESPYATINKAYVSAPTNTASTIYVMDNINNTSLTTMNANKLITLTSSDTNGTYGTAVNTVKRENGNAIINQSAGTLTLNNITIDGNNVSSSSSLLTVKNATFNSGTTLTKATSSGNGGAVYVNGGTLTISAGTYTNNKAGYGGVVFNNGGTVTISNGDFSNNEATNGGGALRNHNNVNSKMTISGGTFSNNKAHAGAAVGNNRNATLTISGGTFTKNIAGGTSGTEGSGGVVFNYGNCTISGGTFGGSAGNGNTARQHGGAFKNWGTMSITDGTISYNESYEEGGAIGTEGDSKDGYPGNLTVNGDNVIIEYNKTSTGSGGGIYGGDGSTINIKKGKIQYNNAKKTGGGISSRGKKIDMSGGNITHNTAGKSGGGIYITDDTSMTLSGGKIKFNTTNESSSDSDSFKGGGGIAVNGKLKMTGGLIAGNDAPKGDGGGIRIGGNGMLELSGGIIRNNDAKKSGGIDNAYGNKGHYSGPGKAYVCKNNNPTNSYDTIKSTHKKCKG